MTRSRNRKRSLSGFFVCHLPSPRHDGKGRVFYNALGHEKAVWESSWFRELMLNGIKWAMGMK